jgi:peptide/nickel transport system permease protein
MANLVARRVVALAAVLFGLAVIVFLLQAVVPADPVRAMVGASAPPEIVAAKRHQLGYDKPLPVRFIDYMGRLASGDLQTSLRTRDPVLKDLGTFAPASLELALAAAAMAAMLGVGLGLALAAGGADVLDRVAVDPAVLFDAASAAGVRARR